MDRTLSELIAAVEADDMDSSDAHDEILRRDRAKDARVAELETKAKLAELSPFSLLWARTWIEVLDERDTARAQVERERDEARERVAAFESIARSLQRWSTEMDGDPGDYIAQRLNALVPEVKA